MSLVKPSTLSGSTASHPFSLASRSRASSAVKTASERMSSQFSGQLSSFFPRVAGGKACASGRTSSHEPAEK